MLQKIIALVLLFCVIPLTAQRAVAVQEICGDGIDNDSSGGDASCLGNDADDDGYTSDVDCDDNNRYIYPNVYVATGCPDGYRKCQSDGTYTSCTANGATPLCEATGGGSCYYFDFVNGSNSNAGTYAAPFKDYLMITYWYDSGDPEKPAGAFDPIGGDVFYFLNGTYTTKYTNDAYGNQAFMLRGRNGTSSNKIVIKNYPGHSPVFNPGFNSGTQGSSVHFFQSSYLVLKGIEITGAYAGGSTDEGGGIRLDDVDNSEFANLWIHDNRGAHSNNPSGFHSATGGSNNTLHHSRLNDNRDASAGSNENETQIVFFTGTGNRIHHNVIYNTAPISDSNDKSGCFKQKHGSSTGTLEVDHNILFNCEYSAIGTGTAGSNLHHNRIFDSDFAFGILDWGGTSHFNNNTITYNTVSNGLFLRYDPVDDYSAIGTMAINNNVANGTGAAEVADSAMLNFHTYGNNADLTAMTTPGNLTVTNNCWYNDGTALGICLFCNNTTGGSNGTLHDWSGWTGAGYDSGSFNEDPVFNARDRATASNCDTKGWSPLGDESGSSSSSSSSSSSGSSSSASPSGNQIRIGTLFRTDRRYQ